MKEMVVQGVIGFLLGRVWIFGINPFAVAYFGVTFTKGRTRSVVLVSTLLGMASSMAGTGFVKYTLLFSLVYFADCMREKAGYDAVKGMASSLILGGIHLVLAIAGSFLGANMLESVLMALLETVMIVALYNVFQCGVHYIVFEKMDKVLGNEELVSLLLIAALALYGFPRYFEGIFSIVEMAAYFIVLWVGYTYGASAGGIAGAAGGILAAVRGDDLMVIGLFCLLGIGVGVFREAGKWITGISFCIMGVVLAYIFKEDVLGIVQLRGIVSAAIIFFAIPLKKYRTVEMDHGEEENPFVREDIRTIANYKMEDFSLAFRKLSQSFQRFATKENRISNREMDLMFENLSDKVCRNCVNCTYCWDKHYETTYQGVRGLLTRACKTGQVTETDLYPEFQSRCIRLDEYIEKANESMAVAKMGLGFRNKLSESRVALSRQLMEVAGMLADFSVELEQVKETGKEEKRRLLLALRRLGLFIRKIAIVSRRGNRLEVQFQAKKKGNVCVTKRDLAGVLYEELGIYFRPIGETKNVIGNDFENMIFAEDTRYKTLTGMARVAKSGETVSGDNFSFMELSTGELLMLLSDGMGSGNLANEDSEALVEILENLMEAGFKKDSAIRLMNSLFVLSYEGKTFTTLDMTSIDLFTGECEVIKNGAAATFIKRENQVEILASGTLPVGIDLEAEPAKIERKLQDGDLVIMVTDGVTDAFPGEEKEFYIQNILQNIGSSNPSEIANTVLMQALERNAHCAPDDMSVLVAGIWKKN